VRVVSVQPEVIEALIPCEGQCVRPTPHQFAFARLRDDGATYWFGCGVCGVRRIYGNTRLEAAARGRSFPGHGRSNDQVFG
jgi:hypothetical protein